ncbi:hypothetical protein SEA_LITTLEMUNCHKIN_59 [Gordonia phage LittleMunchkin]|nr:hypothetical protein SEA_LITTLEMUNCHKIN_59 [Gordonia phage LittleMunchkin]
MNRDDLNRRLMDLADEAAADGLSSDTAVALALRTLADTLDPRETATKIEYAVRAPNGGLVTESVPAHPRSTNLTHPSPGQAWKSWDIGAAASVADAYQMAAVNMGMAELADGYEIVQREVITIKLEFAPIEETRS